MADQNEELMRVFQGNTLSNQIRTLLKIFNATDQLNNKEVIGSLNLMARENYGEIEDIN